VLIKNTVSLKHDGTDGPVKMARLPVPSVSPVVKYLVLEQSLLIYSAKYSALVAYKILELFQY